MQRSISDRVKLTFSIERIEKSYGVGGVEVRVHGAEM